MSWRGFDHRAIYEMVVNAGEGPGVSADAETQWGRMNQAILDAEREIAAAVNATESEWQGTGADAARTAYTPLGAYAVSAAVTAAKTAGGVGGQASLAASTRMYVADNAPPQNFLEYLHSEVGSWDGHTVYDEQAAAVDRLMTNYENQSQENEARFDHWGVPPTVVVTPSAAPPPGPGGAGVGALPDTGGVAPAGGSGITAALSPGAPGSGALPSGAGAGPTGGVAGGAGPGVGGATGAAGIGAGLVPGVGGAPAGGPSGAGRGSTPGTATSGTGGPGTAGLGTGGPGTAGPGTGGAATGGAATGGLGTGGAATGGLGTGGAATGGTGTGGTGTGRAAGADGRPGADVGTGGGVGTGGVARPSDRPLGSPGGSGTGPGPWSRAAADAGRAAAGRAAPASPFRPVVPAVPRTSTPDWRSVLLPPERENPTRTPGEPTGRPANPPSPGGTVGTPGAAAQGAAAQGAAAQGARGAGSPGMHAPMTGAGAGGSPAEGRRRASYLIDDSDAFVDRRWFTEPVITPDDPL